MTTPLTATPVDRRKFFAVATAAGAGLAVGASAFTGAEAATASYAQQVVAQLLVLVNKERAKVGARALKLNSQVQTVAQRWSSNMAKQDRLYHNPSYSQQIPSGWTRCAENVAQNWKAKTPAELASALMTQWMNTAGHRANILNKDFTHFGAGVSFTASGKAYSTQNFARY